ncbi:MAG: hypothetical protein ACRDON_09270 [Gaiellaceae bacterium]
MDPNEGDGLEIRVALDDLVSDPDDRPAQGLPVEQRSRRLRVRRQNRLLSGLTGPS